MSGPSGPLSSFFPFIMKDDKNDLHQFAYRGTVDLDECLYPDRKNIVIAIEAKVTSHYDLAWHKLAYPCYRFIENPRPFLSGPTGVIPSPTEIIPVYCMFDNILEQAYVYVFPQVKVRKFRDGLGKLVKCVVLNEPGQLRPSEIYKVDVKPILEG